MKIMYYDKGGKSISLDKYSELFHDIGYKSIKQETIGSCIVSTVWIGIDHSFCEDDPILIFETMVFGRENDQEQWRYSTLKQAEKGHRKAVSYVKKEKRND